MITAPDVFGGAAVNNNDRCIGCFGISIYGLWWENGDGGDIGKDFLYAATVGGKAEVFRVAVEGAIGGY